jgi:hypothetical protein
MESMSNAPYILNGARFGYRMNDQKVVDCLVHDGLLDIFNDQHMGNTGEIVAERFNVTREDADQMSVWSHQKAHKAQVDGKFDKEIVPYTVHDRKKGDIIMIGVLQETWSYSRDNWGEIKSRSVPFFTILKNKLGYYVTDKFWATQVYNGSGYDAFTIDPIMSGTADAAKYRRVLIDWTDDDTTKYRQAAE